MKVYGRQLLAASATVAILLGAGSARADMQAGIAAWDRGDFAGAVREWRPLAEKGDADAEFNLGQAYKQGKGVPEDPRTALGWYQRAAQQGHPQAQVNVGLLLYNGGRKADAVPWLRKGADLGDPRAQYILGTEMFNGQLVAKDWPRAYALMTLAAGRGLSAASQNLKSMDEYIPLDQRQQGIALARKLESGEEKLGGPPVRISGNEPRPMPLRDVQPRPASEATPRRVPPVQTATRSVPPKPASAKPAAAGPKPIKAAPASAGGRWRVQLGAYGDAGNAQRQWAALRGKAPGFGGLQPVMVRAGAVTRLQAGPVASREAAERLCVAAKAAGSACFPVAP